MTNFFSERPVAEQPTCPNLVNVLGVVNTHTHPRDTDAEQDGRAEMHIPLLAEACEVALCMGNTNPPLTSREFADRKGRQWRRLVPHDAPLQLKVGGLMTEKTSANEVVAGYDKPGIADWDYMKMFVRAASNAHGADVEDMTKVIPVLKAMTRTKFVHREHPMTLAIHMERKFDLFGRRVDVRLRERTSVERDLSYLFTEVPDAKVVVCHVTDAYTLEVIRYLRSKGFRVWGELAPHYAFWCFDDLVEGPGGGTAFNLDRFCLPLHKSEEDRRAIERAMVSGEPWWVFGCDDACWTDDPSKPAGVKVNNQGIVIGGQTQIPAANISYVIEKFAEADKLMHLNNFLSENARDAYGLGPAKTVWTFVREDWIVQPTIERDAPHGKLRARVAMAGAARKFKPAGHRPL